MGKSRHLYRESFNFYLCTTRRAHTRVVYRCTESAGQCRGNYKRHRRRFSLSCSRPCRSHPGSPEADPGISPPPSRANCYPNPNRWLQTRNLVISTIQHVILSDCSQCNRVRAEKIRDDFRVFSISKNKRESNSSVYRNLIRRKKSCRYRNS